MGIGDVVKYFNNDEGDLKGSLIGVGTITGIYIDAPGWVIVDFSPSGPKSLPCQLKDLELLKDLHR